MPLVYLGNSFGEVTKTVNKTLTARNRRQFINYRKITCNTQTDMGLGNDRSKIPVVNYISSIRYFLFIGRNGELSLLELI